MEEDQPQIEIEKYIDSLKKMTFTQCRAFRVNLKSMYILTKEERKAISKSFQTGTPKKGL